MELSDFYKSTIIEVRADFGFDEFDCDPDEITRKLGLSPDDQVRKGDQIHLRSGKTRIAVKSNWSISSNSESKNINDHIRQLLDRLAEVKKPLSVKFGRPYFNILWKGNYLYAGSGPFYEADVISGVASLQADIWQDIYQIDQEEE